MQARAPEFTSVLVVRCLSDNRRYALELRGVRCIDLEEGTPDRKSIMASRSFGRPVTERTEMEEAVASYVSRAAEKLRAQRLMTAHLITFVETNRFKPTDAQHNASRPSRLPVATSDTSKLITAALTALNAIWRPGFRYKKAGVVLLDLHPAADVQHGLFDAPDTPRRQVLMRTVDSLNRRYGRDTMIFAATGAHRAWKLRSDNLSPRYTTCWAELLRV